MVKYKILGFNTLILKIRLGSLIWQDTEVKMNPCNTSVGISKWRWKLPVQQSFIFVMKDDEFLEPLMVPCRTVLHNSAHKVPHCTGEETFQNHTTTGSFGFCENEAEPVLEIWCGQRRAQETWKASWILQGVGCKLMFLDLR